MFREKRRAKRPMVSSIIAMFGLIVALFVAGMVSALSGIDLKITFMVAFCIVATIEIIFISFFRLWQEYGFNIENSIENKVILIPLIILAVIPIFAGIDDSMGISAIVYTVIYMLIVAFVEEVLYRGIILSNLKTKSINYAIIGSAIMFALSHLISATSGKNIIDVIYQIVLAFVMGAILALIAINTRNIYICIGYHALNNISVTISRSFVLGDRIVSYGALIIAVAYLAYLVVKLGRSPEMITADEQD